MNMTSRATPRFLIYSLLLGLALLSAIPAAGAILSTTPVVVEVPAPATVMPGMNTSNDRILAFNEQQCVTLDRLMSVNGALDGEVPYPFVGFPIPAGTDISCHFLHFDPSGAANASGTVTFDSDILGVIVTDPDLDASDSVCGLPGTAYPTSVTDRGAELPGDSASIDLGTRTVTVDLTASNPGDQLRVITRCVPEGIGQIEAKLDQLEPELLDNQAALEAKLDQLQGQIGDIQQMLEVLREEVARIEAKLDSKG